MRLPLREKWERNPARGAPLWGVQWSPKDSSVTIDKGEIVGAYFGHVGSRWGPYSAALCPVTIKGRGRWEPAVDGSELARARVVTQEAL